MKRNRNLKNKVPYSTYIDKDYIKKIEFTREYAGGGWKGESHI